MAGGGHLNVNNLVCRVVFREGDGRHLTGQRNPVAGLPETGQGPLPHLALGQLREEPGVRRVVPCRRGFPGAGGLQVPDVPAHHLGPGVAKHFLGRLVHPGHLTTALSRWRGWR